MPVRPVGGWPWLGSWKDQVPVRQSRLPTPPPSTEPPRPPVPGSAARSSVHPFKGPSVLHLQKTQSADEDKDDDPVRGRQCVSELLGGKSIGIRRQNVRGPSEVPQRLWTTGGEQIDRTEIVEIEGKRAQDER